MGIFSVFVSIGWLLLNNLKQVSYIVPDVITAANKPNITLKD